jgi:hypothetical protein
MKAVSSVLKHMYVVCSWALGARMTDGQRWRATGLLCPRPCWAIGTRQHCDAAGARNFHHCNRSRVRTLLIAQGASRVMHSVPGARSTILSGAILFS